MEHGHWKSLARHDWWRCVLRRCPGGYLTWLQPRLSLFFLSIKDIQIHEREVYMMQLWDIVKHDMILVCISSSSCLMHKLTLLECSEWILSITIHASKRCTVFTCTKNTLSLNEMQLNHFIPFVCRGISSFGCKKEAHFPGCGHFALLKCAVFVCSRNYRLLPADDLGTGREPITRKKEAH